MKETTISGFRIFIFFTAAMAELVAVTAISTEQELFNIFVAALFSVIALVLVCFGLTTNNDDDDN